MSDVKKTSIPLSSQVQSDNEPQCRPGLSRRHFIISGAATVTALSFSGLLSPPPAEAIAGGRILRGRRTEVERARTKAARRAARVAFRSPQRTADEATFGEEFSYTKVLSKNELGEATPQHYRLLKQAIRRGRISRFENTLFDKVGAKAFKNPLAAHALDLAGIDGSQVRLLRPPSIASAWNSAEMAELYWQALCRDVPFTDYWSDNTVSDAASDLSTFYSDFRGPRDGTLVTPATIFRGSSIGDLQGPYLSQFLLMDVVSGTLRFQQKQKKY